MGTTEITTGNVPGLRNWKVDVPGTVVTAYVARWDDRPPGEWTYSLWTPGDDVLSTGHFYDLPADADAGQVARVAFLLDCERQPPAPDGEGRCACGRRCTDDVTYCCACGLRIPA